jgi:hypothetical protein
MTLIDGSDIFLADADKIIRLDSEFNPIMEMNLPEGYRLAQDTDLLLATVDDERVLLVTLIQGSDSRIDFLTVEDGTLRQSLEFDKVLGQIAYAEGYLFVAPLFSDEWIIYQLAE